MSEATPRPLETKIVSITLKSPPQIKNALILEAANSWELAGVGSNFAFLQRERGATRRDLAYQMKSITLSTPGGILKMLQEVGAEGWHLCGMGASFCIFKRYRDVDPIPFEYSVKSVTLKGISGIQNLLKDRGAEGWALCEMGSNFAVFKRPAAPASSDAASGGSIWTYRTVETQAVSVTLRTPVKIEQALDKEGLDGWRLCGVGTNFLFLRKRTTASRT